MNYRKRLAGVRRAMREHDVDALFILLHDAHTEEQKATLLYLSGFTGSTAHGIITKKEQVLIVDSRYTEQAQQEAAGWNVLEDNGFSRHPEQYLAAPRVGVISSEISWNIARWFERALAPAELVPLPNFVESIRAVKEPGEVRSILKAIRATEEALREAYGAVKPGVSEREIAAAFERALPVGATVAFPSIIASGTRSALPHGVASDKIIEAGDIVQFDVGCRIGGYAADISRVVVAGKATREQKRMHGAVREALERSLQYYRAGTPIGQATREARRVIQRRKFTEFRFDHGLGHGLGMKVHEEPFFRSEEVFANGHVVTNEPGIYIPDVGGMRIEEDVLITDDAPRVLTELTSELLEL